MNKCVWSLLCFFASSSMTETSKLRTNYNEGQRERPKINTNNTNTQNYLFFSYLEHLELHPRDRPCLQQLLGNSRDVVPVDDDAAI